MCLIFVLACMVFYRHPRSLFSVVFYLSQWFSILLALFLFLPKFSRQKWSSLSSNIHLLPGLFMWTTLQLGCVFRCILNLLTRPSELGFLTTDDSCLVRDHLKAVSSTHIVPVLFHNRPLLKRMHIFLFVCFYCVHVWIFACSQVIRDHRTFQAS